MNLLDHLPETGLTSLLDCQDEFVEVESIPVVTPTRLLEKKSLIKKVIKLKLINMSLPVGPSTRLE